MPPTWTPTLPEELGAFCGRHGDDRLVFQGGVIDLRPAALNDATGPGPIRAADIPGIAFAEARPRTTWLVDELVFMFILGEVTSQVHPAVPPQQGAAPRVATASTPIEGAAAAARLLGKSARTLRRWLALCPPADWPSASQHGGKPVWRDREELEQWWAIRRAWARPIAASQPASTSTRKPTRPKPAQSSVPRTRIMDAIR